MKLFVLNNVRALQLFQILRQGALILVAIWFAQSYLSPADIGSYEKLLYVGYVTSFFWVTGLTQGLISLVPAYTARDRSAIRASVYGVVAILSLLLIAGLYGFRELALQVLTGQADLPHYELYLCHLGLFLPTYLLEHFYLLDDQPERIACLGLASFAGYFGAVVLPLGLGWGLEGSIAGLVIFALAKHLWLFLYLMGTSTWAWQVDFLKEWGWISLPLIGYAFLGGFHQAFDNWLVGHHYAGDSRRFALFRYGARELPLVIALAGAFSTAMIPELVKTPALGLQLLKERSRRLFHALFPLSILLMLTSPWWFPWVFTEEFAQSVPVFNLFLLITASRLLFPRTILMALHDNQTILFISVLELGCNVLFSFLLVNVLGLSGIALGTVLAFFVGKAMLAAYLHIYHQIPPGRYTDLRWWGIYVVGLAGAYLISL